MWNCFKVFIDLIELQEFCFYRLQELLLQYNIPRAYGFLKNFIKSILPTIEIKDYKLYCESKVNFPRLAHISEEFNQLFADLLSKLINELNDMDISALISIDLVVPVHTLIYKPFITIPEV